MTPSDLSEAYELPATTALSSTQTIGIVDAGNDPAAEADLETYDHKFELPACTHANGCFTQVGQDGTSSLPFPRSKQEREEGSAEERKAAKEWSVEISTDIQIAHAVCRDCYILLVEANSSLFSDLEVAEDTAARLGASEISNSFGGSECEEVAHALACQPDTAAFDHPGVVIAASAGDFGYLDWGAEKAEHGFADYPASSPRVVAVGGTRLEKRGAVWRETVWNGEGAGGGGCSVQFTAPVWQQALSTTAGCGGRRASSDVSADADPYTGVFVYDSESGEVEPWQVIGGTSVASPIVASTFALAGGAHGVAYPARTLYENEAVPGSFHDVVTGSNGKCSKPAHETTGLSGCTLAEEQSDCSGEPICNAAVGYDGPTGVGTPAGVAGFRPPSTVGGGEGKESGAGSKAGEGGGGSGAEAGGQSGGGAGPVLPTSAPVSSPVTPPRGVTPPLPSVGKKIAIHLSELKLTSRARTALARARPNASSVAFAFTLSAAARVRVTLARWVRVRGRMRWVLLPVSLTIASAKGRAQGSLLSHRALSAGRYRLTLEPAGGSPRSTVFTLRSE